MVFYIDSINDSWNLRKITTAGEICFFGRSNVGKSSIINSLFGKKLAFTSKKAGKTVSLNFYRLEKKYTVMDSPGYGFDMHKMQLQWSKLLDDYFKIRENVKMCYILVDSRHDLMQSDLGMIKYLISFRKNFTIIYTKIDKLTKEELQNLEENCAGFEYTTSIFYTSSSKHKGIKELHGNIMKVLKYE